MSLIDNSLKSFRVKTRIPQWIIWSIGVCLFIGSWFAVSTVARSAALRDLKQYQDIWTREGILNQPTDYSCVPAAITMLLTEQGFSPTLYEIAEMSGTDTRGTSGSGIIKSGKNYGFDVIHRRLTFDEFMGIGLPGIIMFKHQGLKHAAYISVVREFNLLRVKDSVQGLLHFERDGANEYFGGEIWDCYLFKRGTVLVDQPE